MRTHRIKFVCSNVDCAKFVEDNLLHDQFCDLTHWYCGLDGAGADTPDCCLIYRGIYEPNVIYVEIDLKELIHEDDDPQKALEHYQDWKKETFWSENHKDWVVSEITIDELPCYAKLKKAQDELKVIAAAIEIAKGRNDAR